jgi:hypothetical protein
VRELYSYAAAAGKKGGNFQTLRIQQLDTIPSITIYSTSAFLPGYEACARPYMRFNTNKAVPGNDSFVGMTLFITLRCCFLFI